MQRIAIMILRFCQRVGTYQEGCGCLTSYVMAAVDDYLFSGSRERCEGYTGLMVVTTTRRRYGVVIVYLRITNYS